MSKLNFSLTQLEYVLAVQQYGHFAKAAEACFVTQPTLSMQIQKLEESLGVILFDRSKKPIRLTLEGEAILEQVQSVLSEAKKIESTLNQLQSGELEGELRIGVIPTVGPYLIPRSLKYVTEHLPKVSLRFYELQTSQILEKLKTDNLDMGIMAVPVEGVNIQQIHLFYEPFYVYCDKSHPLVKPKKIQHSQLTTDDIWLLEEGHCLRTQILDICTTVKKKEGKKQVQLESGSLEMIHNLVKTIGGYTLIPALAVDSFRGGSAVVKEIQAPVPSREVGIVFARQHYKQTLIKAIAEALHSSLPKWLKNLEQKGLEVIPVDLKSP